MQKLAEEEKGAFLYPLLSHFSRQIFPQWWLPPTVKTWSNLRLCWLGGSYSGSINKHCLSSRTSNRARRPGGTRGEVNGQMLFNNVGINIWWALVFTVISMSIYSINIVFFSSGQPSLIYTTIMLIGAWTEAAGVRLKTLMMHFDLGFFSKHNQTNRCTWEMVELVNKSKTRPELETTQVWLKDHWYKKGCSSAYRGLIQLIVGQLQIIINV